MTHRSTRRSVLSAAALATAAVLSACAGIDSAGPGSERHPADVPAMAVAQGRIRFVVDGKPLTYGLLNKPHLRLFHRESGVLISAPEVRADGSYRVSLPAGSYGVAVIHGGLSPSQQPHRLPNGGLVFVNGFVDPGLEFSLEPSGIHDLGTLVVEVRSTPARGLLNTSGERVFDQLLNIRIEGDVVTDVQGSNTNTLLRTPMRRIDAARARADGETPLSAAPQLVKR